MKKNTSMQHKLTLFKTKIANLSDGEMNNVLGGVDTKPHKPTSTDFDFTCAWCTTTGTANNIDARGKEQA